MIEAGFGRLVGSDFDAIVDGVRKLTSSDAVQLLHKANPFGRGDAAAQIAHHLTASSEQSLIAA